MHTLFLLLPDKRNRPTKFYSLPVAVESLKAYPLSQPGKSSVLENLNMQDNTLWFSFWAGTVILLLGFTFLLTNHSITKNKLIAEMVISGVNPITINCAMNDERGKNPTCIIEAVK
jgi:hypothetical protein